MLTSSEYSLEGYLVYLIDTNVIRELPRKPRANSSVIAFLEKVSASNHALHLSSVTVKFRRDVELIQPRGYTL